MNMRKCCKCYKVLPLSCFAKSSHCRYGRGHVCKPCRNIRGARQRRKLKDKIFNAYGGYKCNCCGETEPLFLTIDHINNDGAKQRKLIGNGTAMYYYIKRHNFPREFQVLCLNCNAGKYRNGGICPHQLKT